MLVSAYFWNVDELIEYASLNSQALSNIDINVEVTEEDSKHEWHCL